MAAEDALLEFLTSSWEAVWSGLDPAERAVVSRSAREMALAGQDEDAFGRAALKLLRLLRSVLADTHEVVRAAEEGLRWAEAPPVDWRPVISALSERLEEMVRQDVQDWLADAAALSAAQLRAGGEDPARRFLIRLDSDSGDVRFPAFQFDQQGRAIGVVLEINERLGADEDPWGVADWWLGDNVWLDAVPADLIGVADGPLLAAADAVTAPDRW